MGVVVIGGGGGGGGGGGNKATADGKVVNEREEVVAVFADVAEAEAYSSMLNAESRVIPFMVGVEV